MKRKMKIRECGSDTRDMIIAFYANFLSNFTSSSAQVQDTLKKLNFLYLTVQVQVQRSPHITTM